MINTLPDDMTLVKKRASLYLTAAVFSLTALALTELGLAISQKEKTVAPVKKTAPPISHIHWNKNSIAIGKLDSDTMPSFIPLRAPENNL